MEFDERTEGDGTVFSYFPEGLRTLPLAAELRKRFDRQGSLDPRLPLCLARLVVHLATRFSVPKIGRGSVRSGYVSLPRPGTGLRVVYCGNVSAPTTIFYIHGGGGLFARTASYLPVLENLARNCGCNVVAVDYRRGPEVNFSTSLEDCSIALDWALGHAREIGIAPDRMVLMGDSAGGNLAASLMLQLGRLAKDKIGKMVLVNPVLQHFCGGGSRSELADGYGLTLGALDFFDGQWIGRHKDNCPYVSPLHVEDLGALCETLVVTSEYDPLRDEGIGFTRRLARQQVPVRHLHYLGMAHAMVVFGATKVAAGHFYDRVDAFVNGG